MNCATFIKFCSNRKHFFSVIMLANNVIDNFFAKFSAKVHKSIEFRKISISSPDVCYIFKMYK